jgi:hypothetical protein
MIARKCKADRAVYPRCRRDQAAEEACCSMPRENGHVSFRSRLPRERLSFLRVEESLGRKSSRAGCLGETWHLRGSEIEYQTWIQLNSSMQHTPPSASTSAPASSTHSPLSFTAVTVSPALLLPLPVVITARGLSRAAYLRSVHSLANFHEFSSSHSTCSSRPPSQALRESRERPNRWIDASVTASVGPNPQQLWPRRLPARKGKSLGCEDCQTEQWPCTHRRNCDLPVPGSPANRHCTSPRVHVPSAVRRATPPMRHSATANFTSDSPKI